MPRPRHTPLSARWKSGSLSSLKSGRRDTRFRTLLNMIWRQVQDGYAATESRRASSPRSTRTSAIWTALVAAPLRRLSLTIHMLRARGCDSSRRIRPDEHLVAIGRPQRRRHVLDDHPGSRGEQLARLLGRQRLARLDVDRLGVADPHRHAHAGDGDPDRLVLEDLARLEHHLALLVGVVVAVGEVAGGADHVEGDRLGIHLRRRRLAPVQIAPGPGRRARRSPSCRCRTPTGRWTRPAARSRPGGGSAPAPPSAAWSSSSGWRSGRGGARARAG